MEKNKRTIIYEYLMSMLGGVVYALAFQTFAESSNFFLGNLTGIAQIVYDLTKGILNLGINYTGIILLLINVPLFIISYREINRTFFFKSLLTTLITAASLQVIPSIKLEGISDPLTLSIIGGILCGIGSGLSLKYGGSSGGTDIIGVYFSMKYRGLSVGKINLLISFLVYIYALFTKSIGLLIYSIIFTIVISLVVDRMHYQNQKAQVIIISKSKNIKDILIKGIGRGGTFWKAKGAYSEEDSYVFISVCSKYEVIRLKRLILEEDQRAFIIEASNIDVVGNYESHLF